MDLATYTDKVRAELDMLGLYAPTWVEPRHGVHDVIIVGGGQSGMGAAFGLMRERVSNLLIIDENAPGQEGPWGTYARMITLRTPKHLTSIDLGIPGLTFQAYWTALHGAASWEAIDKIPRQDWLAYLSWYRKVLNLPIENGTRLSKIIPQGDGTHLLQVSDAQGSRTLTARKVILATGIQGGGEWHTPGFVRDALPKSRYAHTSETIDYAGMSGKSIAILGNGASAFDNAQHALNCGVGRVDVFVRRARIPTVNPIRFMEQTGVVPRFAALDDTVKYRIICEFIQRAQPPTNDTFQRASAWPNFKLHLGAAWEKVEDTQAGVRVTTPKGVHHFDYLVLSTGLVTDHRLRPELSQISDLIATWGDVLTRPDIDREPVLDAHPYLGPGFEFTPRASGDAAKLHGLFAFNYSALVSLGLSAAALTGLGYAIPRLANSVANQLFLDDQQGWVERYLAYEEEEFVNTWQAASAEKVMV